MWQIDFTEQPHKEQFKYLLTAIDGFTNWPMAWPCRTYKVREVAKHLLKDLIPNFKIPLWIKSDQGQHFVAKFVQQVLQSLGIEWKLHMPWHPTLSGQVERCNQMLKRQLVKIVRRLG